MGDIVERLRARADAIEPKWHPSSGTWRNAPDVCVSELREAAEEISRLRAESEMYKVRWLDTNPSDAAGKIANLKHRLAINPEALKIAHGIVKGALRDPANVMMLGEVAPVARALLATQKEAADD